MILHRAWLSISIFRKQSTSKASFSHMTSVSTFGKTGWVQLLHYGMLPTSKNIPKAKEILDVLYRVSYYRSLTITDIAVPQ